ncbi:MAG TPA: hypothetical protein VFZ78_09725, partial [Flavisolibacter sp.]
MIFPAIHPLVRIFVFCLLVITAGSCHYYLPAATDTSNNASKGSSIREGRKSEKYFILRHGSGNYAMNDLQVDQQAQTLSFQLAALPEEHKHYIKFNRRYQFTKKRGENVVLNEVHIYANGTAAPDTVQRSTMPLDSVYKIEVIEFDRARTSVTYVMGGVGAALGAITVAGIIILLTKSSCPFVAAYNGDTFEMQGELFGGAIYPSLERNDFVPLRIRPVNGEFRIRISNELPERQYTNFADLLVIEHDETVQAMVDEQGNIYTIGRAAAPVSASLNGNVDVTELVRSDDGQRCMFNDPALRETVNSLHLLFDRPAGQQQARLVLDLKNSYWFDLLFGEFTRGFGSYYNRWTAKQRKVPASQLEEWSRSQNIPMHISLKTSAGWQSIADLKTIGPLTDRQLVVPVDLENVEGDKIEIRLTTGFLFWEVDMAAMDFSRQQPVKVRKLAPYSAID